MEIVVAFVERSVVCEHDTYEFVEIKRKIVDEKQEEEWAEYAALWYAEFNRGER